MIDLTLSFTWIITHNWGPAVCFQMNLIKLQVNLSKLIGKNELIKSGFPHTANSTASNYKDHRNIRFKHLHMLFIYLLIYKASIHTPPIIYHTRLNHNQGSFFVSRVLRAINSINSFPCWIAIAFTGKNLKIWTWQKKNDGNRTEHL